MKTLDDVTTFARIRILLKSLRRPCLSLGYFIIFESKLYRHIVGIPIGTNYAPLVADLFSVLL